MLVDGMSRKGPNYQWIVNKNGKETTYTYVIINNNYMITLNGVFLITLEEGCVWALQEDSDVDDEPPKQ